MDGTSHHDAGRAPVDASLSALADIVKRRGVRRIVYFHADHFEPWSYAPGRRNLEACARDVMMFAERSAANEYARRLTLFYKAGVTQTLQKTSIASVSPDDYFGFARRTAEQERFGHEAMHGLVAAVGHEIQVHMHHEHYTYNTGHTNPEVIAAFARPEIRAMDSDRFDLGVKLSLATTRAETGLPLDRWFFVHGVWALNASDPRVCHITDEIEILMRNGCLGDFTFPAGRRNVDPLQTQPFFVKPFKAYRAYNLAGAEPESAFGNREAAKSKFFIWASDITHEGSSLDYYSDWLEQKLIDPNILAREVLERSNVTDGTLWFKTHSHSMHPKYWREDMPVVFPHDHPGVRGMMGRVFDAGGAAGASVEFLTVSEVYDEFTKADAPARSDFSLPVPRFVSSDDLIRPVAVRGVDEVNASGLKVLRAAIEESGQAASGAGEYYARRVDQGELLTAYELRIVEVLLTEKPRPEVVYDLASGVSAMTVLLALNGLRSVGVERDPARVKLGRAILESVGENHPGLDGMCELPRAAVPEFLRDLDTSRAAAVFTNVTGYIAPEELDELIGRLSAFQTVILDPRCFFEMRDSEGQGVLLNRLTHSGLGAPARLSSSKTEAYWLFYPEPDSKARPPARRLMSQNQ